MRVVLLVPRRNDDGVRDRIWAWCKARWLRYHPDIPIYEGHHTVGPFNRSAAVNTAARLADAGGRWDIGIVIDSDIFLRVSQVRAMVTTAEKTGHVTWAHRRWRGFHESWTKRVLDDSQDFGAELDRDDMDIYVERTNPISWSCCIAFPRGVFDDLGGFDERFVGWGFEDMALQSVVVGMYGHERIEGDVYHLFHPRSEERIIKGQPGSTASRAYMVNARLGRRYMVALRRDHGLHDRPGLPASEEERLRDIDNLVRDDAKLAIQAGHFDFPDWSKWWPTLEELRDGAKAHIATQNDDTVTVVVTSGGDPATWPERREYLRRTLASLTENVTGRIVQRVIYTDWPDELRPEVEAIAAEFPPFYVAGSGHHGHTGMRQRMWKYLSKRAVGAFVFGCEDDFLFTRPTDLRPMVETLLANQHLAQLALLRAPAYESERQRGGILGHPVDAFKRLGTNGSSRLEHVRFWTNNPSLYRRSLTLTPWPESREDPATGRGKGSEVVFAEVLLRDPRLRFAFWGEGDAWIEHIGEVRAGSGY